MKKVFPGDGIETYLWRNISNLYSIWVRKVILGNGINQKGEVKNLAFLLTKKPVGLIMLDSKKT